MIDKKFIGMAPPVFQATAGRSAALFRKATGEANPVYLDESAARAAGYSGLPLPPTFLFSLELSQPSTRGRSELGLTLRESCTGNSRLRIIEWPTAGEKLSLKVG